MSELGFSPKVFDKNVSTCEMAANDHGLLPWRTSNLVNVPRPSGVTYFKTPRGRTEPWQQTDVGCRFFLFLNHLLNFFLVCQGSEPNNIGKNFFRNNKVILIML